MGRDERFLAEARAERWHVCRLCDWQSVGGAAQYVPDMGGNGVYRIVLSRSAASWVGIA